MLSRLKQGIQRRIQAASNKRHLNFSAHSQQETGRLPTFLVIGAAKAGTTSLYHYLNSHPAVYMSPVKEPHFFTYQGQVPDTAEASEATRLLPPETTQLKTLADYSKLFAGARKKHLALGEASTGYLCGNGTPALVRAQLPEVKLIALLRNPVERAWSEFRMMRRFDEEPESSLLHIINDRTDTRYLELGNYSGALHRWYAAFPQQQMQVHLFEDFTNDTAMVVAKVLQHIGVDTAVKLDFETRHNARGKNEPLLDAKTRAALIEYFREDVQRTEQLLDKDLGHWLI